MDRKRTVQKYRAFLRNAYDNNQGDTVCNILLMASSELKRYSKEFEQLQAYAKSLQMASLVARGISP